MEMSGAKRRARPTWLAVQYDSHNRVAGYGSLVFEYDDLDHLKAM
jgi:hypothetical protein